MKRLIQQYPASSLDKKGEIIFKVGLVGNSLPDACTWLLERLEDQNVESREQAIRVIDFVHSLETQPLVIAALIERLNDKSYVVQLNAACILGKMSVTPPEVWSKVSELLEHKERVIREAILKRVGDLKSLPPQIKIKVFRLLQDRQFNIRVQAIKTLRKLKIQSPEITGKVIEMLRDKKDSVRKEAVTYFHQWDIANNDVVLKLIELLSDESELVRCQVVKTLGQLNIDSHISQVQIQRGHIVEDQKMIAVQLVEKLLACLINDTEVIKCTAAYSLLRLIKICPTQEETRSRILNATVLAMQNSKESKPFALNDSIKFKNFREAFWEALWQMCEFFEV